MPARLRFGDIEIDVAAFELRRNSALHAVEPQVFELLTYLARNAGRLITKDELIEALWDGRIVSDATLALAYAAIANCDSYLLCMGDPGVAFQDILANCGRALALQPDLADAHAAEGLALFTAGDSAEGSLALERAMKLGPDSFEAHFFAGRCYRSQGRFAEAARAFERAATLQPDDFRALGLLTNVYRSLGREQDARSAAQRCLERIKAELAVHRDDAKALAFGATILADFGELAQAEEWAKRSEALDPDDLITHYNLACAWVALGRHEAGIGRLERMFEVPAETTQLHLNWMKHDISLGPLHGHPRYEALLRRLEMPAQPTESKRARP